MEDTAPKSQSEQDQRRDRRLAALERLQELHKRILERRGGVPIDVDSVLDEIRGRGDFRYPEAGMIKTENDVLLWAPGDEPGPEALKAQRLAAIAAAERLHRKVMKRLGGVRPDGDAILRDLAEGRES